MSKTSFSISNIAGGGLRTFRLLDGRMSAASVKHARNIGYGGPEFSGPAASEARRDWERRAAEDALDDFNYAGSRHHY